VAQVAVCSQINTKHINTVWAERTVVKIFNLLVLVSSDQSTSLDATCPSINPIDCSSIEHSQKALGTLPDDDNVMPKRVGATIYN
jgi:hypothetical protein